MRGRKPTPVALRILRGNPRQKPIPAEPSPAKHDGAPPAWLDGDALEEWRRLVPQLQQLGLLTTVDGDALVVYCQTFARWRQAERELAAHGQVRQGRWGLQASPWVGIARELATQLRNMLTEFGMTPSSRSRVKATGPAPMDPFFEFDKPAI